MITNHASFASKATEPCACNNHQPCRLIAGAENQPCSVGIPAAASPSATPGQAPALLGGAQLGVRASFEEEGLSQLPL